MGLDEIRAVPVLLVAALVDRDRLDHRPAAVCQQLPDLAEIGRPVLLADRLDHLDGDDAVERAGAVAIVFQFDPDAVCQALAFGGLARVGQLLGRKRDALHVCTGCRQPVGQRAPAAADFEHPLPGLRRQEFGDASKLVLLCLLQRLTGCPVEGGRIGHARIEPQAIEFVAEIVVIGNVAPAPRQAVGAQEVAQPVHRPGGPRSGNGPVDLLHVGHGEFEQGGEVGGRPLAVEIGFGEGDIAAQDQAPHRAPAVQVQDSLRPRRAGLVFQHHPLRGPHRNLTDRGAGKQLAQETRG